MMRGSVLARRLGGFDAYVEAVFAAMWEEAADIPAALEIRPIGRS